MSRYGYGFNKEKKIDTKFKNLKKINNIQKHPPLVGRGPCQRNLFFENTLRSMGGSEVRAIDLYKNYGRFGGSRVDSILYMKNFDKKYPTLDLDWKSNKEWCLEIFGKVNHIKLFDMEYCLDVPDVPSDTSPGITYKRLGFIKKADALPVCLSHLRDVLKKIEKHELQTLPEIAWCIAGRPKFTELNKAFQKVYDRQSVGRSIWVSDMEEAILSRHFTRYIDKNITGTPTFHKIMINFDKVKDAKHLQNWVEQYDYIIEADYSKFDSSVPACVVRKAFQIFKELFVSFDHTTSTVYDFLIENFLNSKVDLSDGRLLQKFGGVPSGSGFTSIIGSICNYIMLDTCFMKMGLDKNRWSAIVYGDDCLIGIKKPLHKHEDSAFKIRKLMLKFMQLLFDITLDPKETKLVCEKYVSVIIPEYDEDTTNGTSLLKPSKMTRIEKEPDTFLLSNSSSHRWWYSFEKTWKFLGYSLTCDGRLIRPTRDVLARIYNPEKPVKSWDEHVTLLKMAYLENYENAHTRNRIYHYLMDAWWVIHHGCPQRALPDVDYTVSRGRCFHRYTNHYVHLRWEPSLEGFHNFFDNFDFNMLKLHIQVSLNEFYYSRVKRGRLSSSLFDMSMRPAHYHSVAYLCKKLGMVTPQVTTAYTYSKEWFQSHPGMLKNIKKVLRKRMQFYQHDGGRKKFKKMLQNFKKIRQEFSFLYPNKPFTIHNPDIIAAL